MTARMSPATVNDGVKQNHEREGVNVYGHPSHRTQQEHGEKTKTDGRTLREVKRGTHK